MLRRMRSELTCKIKVSHSSAGIRNTTKKKTGTPSRFSVSVRMLPHPPSCRPGDGPRVDRPDGDACLTSCPSISPGLSRYHTEDIVQTTRANIKRGIAGDSPRKYIPRRLLL